MKILNFIYLSNYHCSEINIPYKHHLFTMTTIVYKSRDEEMQVRAPGDYFLSAILCKLTMFLGSCEL